MGPVFCFVGRCPGFICVLISVSLYIQFVLNSFSKLITTSSFSGWPVIVVVFSIYRMVNLNSRRQSIACNGFMSFRLIIDSSKNFLIPLTSSSIVTFQVNSTSFIILLTSWSFLVIGNFFLSFIFSLSNCIILTGGLVLTMNYFSVPSFFDVMITWFLRSVRCFISVIIFTDLSASLSSVSSGSVSFFYFFPGLCSN